MTDLDLDAALDRLAKRTTIQERLNILREVAEFWNSAIGVEDGFSEDELKPMRIPLPLQAWYRLAGRRPELIASQNHICSPQQLEVDDNGRATFYWENQGVYEWSTSVEGDDPLVWGRFNHVTNWTNEGIKLSEFLIQACLLEGIWSAPFGALAGCADQKTMARITSPLKPLPTPPWHWPGYPARIYYGSGAFAFACPFEFPDPRGYSIWVGAKNREALRYLWDFEYDWDFSELQ